MTKLSQPPKLPAKLAQVADLLYATRAKRLALMDTVNELEALETACKDKLIKELPKGAANGITGRVAHVEIATKAVPTVEDWSALYKYVARTKSFELLQRRLSEAAVKERWQAKKVIPGVGTFTATTVSCTKRGE